MFLSLDNTVPYTLFRDGLAFQLMNETGLHGDGANYCRVYWKPSGQLSGSLAILEGQIPLRIIKSHSIPT